MLALVLVPPAAGQAVRAVVSVDSVQVGERFTLSLMATHRFTSSVTFPPASAGADVFGDVEALRRTPVATRYLGSDDPGVRVDSVAYEVTTFALDTARVPAIPVSFVLGADTVRVTSSPLYIPVRSTLPPDPNGLRGLAPLATFSGPRWAWILLGIVALVLIFGAVYYWRQYRGASEETPFSRTPTPSVPPQKAARQRLQELERSTDWNDPQALKRLFVELSTTVRIYAARRLGVSALERTTSELLHALHTHTTLPSAAIDKVRDVLEQADLVKFADMHPTARDGRTALQKAHSAIDDVEQALQPPSTPMEASPSNASTS